MHSEDILGCVCSICKFLLLNQVLKQHEQQIHISNHQSFVMTYPLSFSSVFHFSLYFPLFSSIQVGMTTDETNGFIWRSGNHTIPISPLRSGQAIQNQSEPPQTMLQCHRTPDRYWGIQLMSCITLGPPNPPTPSTSIPLPTHSEQSKPRAQAGKTVMILQVWAQIKRSWGNTLKSVFGWYTHTEPLGDLSWHEIGRSCIETVQHWKLHWCPVSLMKETNYTRPGVMTGLRWESVVLYYQND